MKNLVIMILSGLLLLGCGKAEENTSEESSELKLPVPEVSETTVPEYTCAELSVHTLNMLCERDPDICGAEEFESERPGLIAALTLACEEMLQDGSLTQETINCFMEARSYQEMEACG